jgi:two-component system, chemotaxis family, chemotaxis protein CheY
MGKRILVVDDSPFIRSLAKELLAPKGYEVAGEAVDGNEAIQKYSALKPDLVLMDLKMDGMNGFNAAKKILEQFPDARIVMVTSYGTKEIIINSMLLGIKDFLVKPFAVQRFLSAVENALK